MKKALVLFLVAVLCLGTLCACGSNTAENTSFENKDLPTGSVDVSHIPGGKVSVGDVVKVGSYGGEAIEWIVLDVDTDTRNVMLVSKYCLDAQPYNAGVKRVETSWETCSLRAWLNTNFFNAAFSQVEQMMIFPTKTGKTDATDTVFLLSRAEATSLFANNAALMSEATEHAENNGAYTKIVKYVTENDEIEYVTYSPFWLRDSASNADRAIAVLADGTLPSDGWFVNDSGFGVRPAIWINSAALTPAE